MDKYSPEELEKKLERLHHLKGTIARDTAEAKELADDLKARYPVGTNLRAGNLRMNIVSAASWRNMRDHEVAVDYPMADYPSIYTPRYSLLKELLEDINSANPGANLKAGDYCEKVTTLYVSEYVPARPTHGRKRRS